MGGLPRATYERILRDVDVPVCCCLHLGLLAARYPGVAQDTVCAIFAQENQYKVIKSHHVHKANMPSYCSRYLAGEDMLQLCAEVDFPPCLMMRRMLELLLRLSKQRVSDVLKQPALLRGVDAAACLDAWQQQQQQATASPMLAQQQHQHQRNHHHHHQHPCAPRSCSSSGGSCESGHTGSSSSGGSGGGGGQCSAAGRPDPQALLARLQVDVVRCVAADRAYSPLCDMAKSLAGLEHEALLYAALDAAGIPHLSEQQLRERGLFKTPDALLQVPVCMRDAAGGWHVVHWIDSKASFGDDRTHRQQLEGQYATYVNRYGPGCVIYWFGFIADLAGSGSGGSSGGGCADVHVRDGFPCAADILQLPQLGAAGSSCLAAA